MKNGYYLSTYLYINKLGYLTGIELRHDMSLCLWYLEENKLRLVKFWELERYTGCKQHRIPFFDEEHARKVINELLSELDLDISDIEAIWGTPELDTDIVSNYSSIKDYPTLCYHSICHLFSSLFSNSNLFYNENILSFAVDGAPDNVLDDSIENKDYYCGSYSEKGEIKSIFPVDSPGIHWGYARYKFKMREGSLMALASASTAKIKGIELPLIPARNKFQVGPIIDSIDELYLQIENNPKVLHEIDKNFDKEENQISAVMKNIQSLSIKIMEKNIEEAIEKYGIDTKNTYLSLSGGYALNCPTNSYLIDKYKFKGFIAPPFVNEVGQSIGVGLYSFYKNSKVPLEFDLSNPYLGKDISNTDLKKAVEEYSEFIYSIDSVSDETIAKDIEENIIVWMEGRAEMGPRALGHRSLIGDPRNIHILHHLNEIKKRQWWRPVAPIILEDEIEDWFERGMISKYMLRTFKLKNKHLKEVPAIVHLDQSARVQTIDKNYDGRLYSVIKLFFKNTGVPIVCNTSLNDAGEPIINTIEEMFNFALRKKIEIVYVNGKRIKLKNFEDYSLTQPAKRQTTFDIFDSAQKEELLKQLNPYQLHYNDILVYVQNPKLSDKVDIKTPEGAKQLQRVRAIRKNRFHVL